MGRMSIPVAYIRKSTRGGVDSRSDQIANVLRAVPEDDRDRLLILDGDWGISAAREKQAKRLDFARLMDMVEAGEVAHLYAYSHDRLARNVGWSARLLDAGKDAGLRITTGEKTWDPRDPMDRQMWHFTAMQNEAEVEKYQRKAVDRVARSRERGVKLGPPFYGSLPGEDVGAVLAAFEAVGSANGAAVKLNQDGNIKPRRGKVWTQSTVRQILVREGVIPRLGVRGVKPRGTFTLSRLLRCHCGRLMSGARHPGGYTIYRCVSAQADPNHGKKSVVEGRVLPWVQAEAARFRIPADAVEMDAANDAERARLIARREGVLETYLDPTSRMTKEHRNRLLIDVDEQLAKLPDEPRIENIPQAIDWATWDPASINAVLRTYWSAVELDQTLRPVRASWRLPPEYVA